MKIKVDWSELQEADDGSTSHYGGWLKLSWMDPATDKITEYEHQCHGSDRDIGTDGLLVEALECALKIELTPEQLEAVTEQDCCFEDGFWDSEKKPSPDVLL